MSRIRFHRWLPSPLVTAPTVLAAEVAAGFVLNPYVPFAYTLFGATACSLLLLALQVRRDMRLRRRLRAHSNEVCPGCHYVLSGLTAPGVCPECGKPFPADWHRSAWW